MKSLPIRIIAGKTYIIPLAIDSPPLDIPCVIFLPSIPLSLANTPINIEPIIAPGIPAATVNPDFIPE